MTTPLQHTSLGELGSSTPLLTTSLGELGSTTAIIVPGGGMGDIDDAMRRVRSLRKRTQRNIRHMLILATLFTATQDDQYVRRQEDDTDETD